MYWPFVVEESKEKRFEWLGRWNLVSHADDPFPSHAATSSQTSAGGRSVGRSVAAYRAHAGVDHDVFPGVDNASRFALCLQVLLCRCGRRLRNGGGCRQRGRHRDAGDGALGQLGTGRRGGRRRGIQNLHRVGLGQLPGPGGVVAVPEGEDVVRARKFENEVLDAAGPVQAVGAGGSRGRFLGGGGPDLIVLVPEGPLGGGGLGRALKEANTTTSIQ